MAQNFIWDFENVILNFWWRHQIGIREIVQMNSSKHGFQKQPFINVLQNRCS